MGVGGQRHDLAALPQEGPGTHCIGGWVAPGPVCTGAENLAPTGIRSPDLPTRSESLYQLSYPGPLIVMDTSLNNTLKVPLTVHKPITSTYCTTLY